jgi:hypothetical protein
MVAREGSVQEPARYTRPAKKQQVIPRSRLVSSGLRGTAVRRVERAVWGVYGTHLEAGRGCVWVIRNRPAPPYRVVGVMSAFRHKPWVEVNAVEHPADEPGAEPTGAA